MRIARSICRRPLVSDGRKRLQSPAPGTIASCDATRLAGKMPGRELPAVRQVDQAGLRPRVRYRQQRDARRFGVKMDGILVAQVGADVVVALAQREPLELDRGRSPALLIPHQRDAVGVGRAGSDSNSIVRLSLPWPGRIFRWVEGVPSMAATTRVIRACPGVEV